LVKKEAKACDRGASEACTNVAAAWLDGSLGRVDTERARTLLEAACADGAHLACVPLADLVTPERARQVLQRACDAGAPQACLALGGRLDDAEAYAAFSEACEARLLEGCYEKGLRLRAGRGVQAHPEEGRELLRRTCSMGSMPSCRELARLYIDELGDENLGRTLALGACRGGDGEGCAIAARLLRDAEDAEDRESAGVFSARACELGYAPACEGSGAPR
jgi:TPR repeat protein